MEELTASWQRTTNWWRKELGEVSDECANWQPFARSHSIGALLLHIADVESLWLEEYLSGRLRSQSDLHRMMSFENRPQEEKWVTPPGWAFRGYLNLLDEVRERSLSILNEMGDPNRYFVGPDGPTTIALAVQFLQNHEAYHAGQAVLHRIHFGWGGEEPKAA